MSKESQKRITFQALSWEALDDDYNEDMYQDTSRYTVYISGKTEFGETVTVKTRFEPFFLVKTVDKWSSEQRDEFLQKIFRKEEDNKKYRHYIRRNGKKWHKISDGYSRHEWLQMKVLDAGYTGPVPYECYFLQLFFNTNIVYQKAKKAVQSELMYTYLKENGLTAELYEGALAHQIRLMHFTGIEATGWLSVPTDKRDKNGVLFCNYKDMLPVKDCEKIAPFLQLSYDIETYSPDPAKKPDPNVPECVVLQIASVFTPFGQSVERSKKYIYNLGPCNDIYEDPNTILRCFETEKEMLLAWKQLILVQDPDIIYAYNGWGYDDQYLCIRAEYNDCSNQFLRMGRAGDRKAELRRKEMKSNAYGDNEWYILTIFGRLNVDPLVYLQREFKLREYGLKFTSEHFLSKSLDQNPFTITENESTIYVRQKKHNYRISEYVHFSGIDTPDSIMVKGQKEYVLAGWNYEELNENLHRVIRIDENGYWVEMGSPASQTISYGGGANVKAFKTKDDIDFTVMWEAYRDSDAEIMKKCALYCVKDAILPQMIMDTLCVLPNLIEMSKCTWVPFEFLFSRGQQVKVHSQISRTAWSQNWAIPTADQSLAEDSNGGYEGGLVLEPFPGFYDTSTPVGVPDYASLYPSTMRDHNYCYTTLVKNEGYASVEGESYQKTEFDDGSKPAIFAQNRKGLIPQIIETLLSQRSLRKKKMAAAKTPLEKMIHNGAQLALKVSANSIYGFMGVTPKKSMLPCLPIAKATTKNGQKATKAARRIMEDPDEFADIVECTTHFPLDYIHLVKKKGKCFHITTEKLIALKEEDRDQLLIFGDEEWTKIVAFNVAENGHVQVELERGNIMSFHHLRNRQNAYSKDVPAHLRTAEYAIELSKRCFGVAIYGDTDSVFMLYDSSHLQHKSTAVRVVFCQLIAAYAAARVTKYLTSNNKCIAPEDQFMNLEYEKVYKFIQLYSKKRYAGVMVEFDPDKVKSDEKGVARKRRDFCLFVKEIFSKVLAALFDESRANMTRQERIKIALQITKEAVSDLLEGRVPFNKLVITKLLKSEYRQREKKQRSAGTKKYQKSDFGPKTMFVGDSVTYKRGRKRYTATVKHKHAVNPMHFLMGTQKPPVELQDGKRIQYCEIVSRKAAIVPLTLILDPEAPEEQLEPITHAHVRLARKMKLRDPATAPKSGERVPFIFCETKQTTLQYLKAENPTYAREHNMRIDAEYYLEKQFRTSIAQILDNAMPGSSDAIFKHRVEQTQTLLKRLKTIN